MHTRPTKAAITIQERKQFNNLSTKKEFFYLEKNLPASLKKSGFSFRRMGWLRVRGTLVGGGI